MLRRLAEGVAEAHRVGLAVGGLTPENVVLRPNGLVGLRAVPAATGTVDGDIAALGALLEACLTGLAPGDGAARAAHRPLRPGGARPPGALHRARAGAVERRRHGLAARRAPAHRARAARVGPAPHRAAPRRHRQRLAAPAPRAPSGRRSGPTASAADRRRGRAVRLDPQTLPPVPGRAAGDAVRHRPLPPAALGGDTIDAGSVAPRAGAYAVAPDRPPAARHARHGDAVLGGTRRALRRPAGRRGLRRLRRVRRPRHRRDRHRRGRRPAAPARRHRPAAARAASWSSRWPGGSARPCST